MRVEDVGGDQEKLLDHSTKLVKAEAFEMKRCLDKGKTMDALKHAVTFLSELKTNDLSPKFYYRLYMDAVNELQHLESFLVDEYERDKTKIKNLYECVQYAGSIVPRMYLLVTIGVVYIKCGEGSKRDILADIVEMCRGVQHPLRGLFLRNYLLQSTRSLLPDLPDEGSSTPVEEKSDSEKDSAIADQERENGDTEWSGSQQGHVRDAIAFILLNFAEMNKLWVRMQHQGPSREREKREKDRMELRILVGTNLVRLSQLENLSEEMYVKEVLPSILEQVVSCRDHISQEYLMECVIQVFADEYHLATLRDFLNACGDLAPEVNVKNVLIALIERLALFAANPDAKGISEEMELFDIFSEQAKELIKSRPEMPMEDIISLHVALVSLALKCYKDKLEYANMTFGSLKAVFEEKGVASIEAFGVVGRELSKLLRIPIDEYNNMLRVAELTEFVPVMETFDYRGRCLTNAYIVQNMLDNDTLMVTEENLAVMCAILDSLLIDQPDQPEDAPDSEDFEDEQQLIARMVHLIRAETPDEQFLLLNNARKVLGAGGRYRIQYTLAPIVFAIFKLIIEYAEQRDEENWDAKVKKMFVCAMGTIGALISTAEMAELPLKLYLQGAVVADKVNFEDNSTVVYEFMSKALSVLEDEIADSRDRSRCFSLVTGSLLQISSLPEESWQPLASHCLLGASKVLKKADQVRGLCSAINLFWSGQTAESEGPLRNGSKVAETLKKAVKISSQIMEPLIQQQLFIHVLDTYIYYYEDGCEEISEDHLVELVSRTKDNAVQLDVSAEADSLEKHLASTLQHIKQNRDKRPALADRLQL